jgi:carboxymethylenebutenolidase
MANVRTEEVELTVDGGKMPTFVAYPEAAGPRPVVLVFQEIFGVNDHIKSVARRVAEEGYVAIAPDYHHRAWPTGTVLPYNEEGMKKGMEVIPKLTFDGIEKDIDACLAFAKTKKEANTAKLGAMGFCIGGHMTYLAAATRPIAAAASFYGGGIATFAPPGGDKKKTIDRTGDIKGKIICFFGKEDPMISADQVEAIKKALAEHKVRHEVVVYDNASHAFFRDPDPRMYREHAAKDAWERTKRLFKEELG